MPIGILKQRRCRICGKTFIAEAGDVLPQKLSDVCPKCESMQFLSVVGEFAKKIIGKER